METIIAFDYINFENDKQRGEKLGQEGIIAPLPSIDNYLAEL